MVSMDNFEKLDIFEKDVIYLPYKHNTLDEFSKYHDKN